MVSHHSVFSSSQGAGTTFVDTDTFVFHIERDIFNPSNIIFADNSCLKTTNGKTTELIAGSVTEMGYIEGVGRAARFEEVSGFASLSPTQLIVIDHGNHCVRLVDRLNQRTNPYVGSCMTNGDQDGYDAKFAEPLSIILDAKNLSQFIIYDMGNNAFKTVAIRSKYTETLSKFSYVHYFRGVTQHQTTGDLYITFEHGVAKYDYQSKAVTLIAGSSRTPFLKSLYNEKLLKSPTTKSASVIYQYSYQRKVELSKIKFDHPSGVAILSDQVLVVADTWYHQLRILELDTGTGWTICSGAWPVWQSVGGGLSNCSLVVPYSLLVDGEKLYVGGSERIFLFKLGEKG